MKGISKFAFVLMMSLLLLAGCQSQDIEEAPTVVEAPAEAAVPADIPAAPVQEAAEPAPAEEPAEPVAAAEPAAPAEPVSASFSYHGYELDIKAYDGYAVITYPSIATKDDVTSFLGYAAEALPAVASEISYSFDSDTALRLVYPAGVDEDVLRAYAAIFGSGALDVAKAAYPSSDPYTVTYGYAGYEVVATIGDGEATLAYPDVIPAADIESFFAYENVRTAGSGILDGVYYSIPQAGQVDISYPASTTRAEAIAFSAIAVNDMILFFAV